MSETCPSCSAKVEAHWKLCPECGASLAPPASESAVSFSDRPQTVLRKSGARASGSATFARGDAAEGRYRVEGELGRGGMGIVYRARDERLGRAVALKRLLHVDPDDEHVVERFVAEAKAIAALNHPNILTVYDVGTDEQGHYIAMELVDGQPLDALIRGAGGKLDEVRAVELFRGICAGIECAHRQGVIHRDIKPANVLVTRDGVPKVADFGLARQGRASGLSITGFGMGTMDYAAPEQKRDAKNVDHRADIYSLGCTFYEMLSGHRPPAHVDHVPARWRTLITRATDPDPARRPFSIGEMLADLGAPAVGSATTSVPPPPLPPSAGGPPPLPRSAPATSGRLPPPVAPSQLGEQMRRGLAVRAFDEGPDAEPLPSHGKAFLHQLRGKGFAYLGLRTRRGAFYFVCGLFALLAFAIGVEDEFRDEDIAGGFALFFLAWIVGFVDVAIACERVRSQRRSARP